MANNPCGFALTKMETWHRSKGMKLPLSLAVSIGTGIYPVKQMGSVNVQDFAAPGRHWFSVKDNVLTRTQNLIELFATAVSVQWRCKTITPPHHTHITHHTTPTSPTTPHPHHPTTPTSHHHTTPTSHHHTTPTSPTPYHTTPLHTHHTTSHTHHITHTTSHTHTHTHTTHTTSHTPHYIS